MSPNYFSTGRRRLQGGKTADEDSPIGGVLRQPEPVSCRAAATHCFARRDDALAPDASARQLACLPCKAHCAWRFLSHSLQEQGSAAFQVAQMCIWVQVPAGGAQPSVSQSNSFAFSRAGFAATPGVQSCPEDDQAARMHPLGFFAAEGARQLCHIEGDDMLQILQLFVLTADHGIARRHGDTNISPQAESPVFNACDSS